MAVSDWDRREICSDGSCTGLIGPEGTCKVCGRAAPNWGDERKRGTVDEDDDEDEDDEDDDDEVEADPIAPSTPVEIGGGEWTARRLCSDGACVGVIGDDGKCKTCGKAAGPAVARTQVEDDDEDEEDDDDEDDDASDDDENEDAAATDEEDESDDEEEEDDDEDEDDEEDDDDDEDHEDLAAAADQLAGVASTSEVAAADALAVASKPEPKAKKPKSDADRQLCPDGACIGVIGADGKCKVCGKEAAA